METFALSLTILLSSLTLIIAQATTGGPACAQPCIDRLPLADSKCDSTDLACRCSDSDVTKEIVWCFMDQCSEEDTMPANTKFVDYCLDIVTPPIPAEASALSTLLDSIVQGATPSPPTPPNPPPTPPVPAAPTAPSPPPTPPRPTEDPSLSTYTQLQANPSESAALPNAGHPMAATNVDISRTAVMATVLLAVLVMSAGLLGSCM